MQTRKTQSSGAQLIRRKSISRPSKEKPKSKEKPLQIRKNIPRRLEPTKDVVPNFKKEKSKASGSSTSKGPLGTLPPKGMKRDPYRVIKSNKQPPQHQRKHPPGIAHVRRKIDGIAMAPLPHGPETGIARRYLKSQEPSPSSLITLTSRVKRREEKMKRSKEMSLEADDKQFPYTRKWPQKKAEDNYKEVFPEVKLDFDMTTAHTSRSPEEHAPTQPSTLMSPFMTATTVSESPTKADVNMSKEAVRKSETPPAPAMSTAHVPGSGTPIPPQSTKPKHRYLPVHDPALLSLACTQRLSQMLTPTPQSQRSRLLSLKSYQTIQPRSQFIAMPDRLPCTGLPCIRNKDNDGNLIIKGTPFWVEDMPEDLTDEGNVLNAAVILDVVAGKLALVNMPDEQIELDIYADWETLRSRDATCFNKDVLFGNTIRSMVNLFEASMRHKEARKVPETKFSHSLISIVDPTTIVHYMRDNLGYLTEVEFVASYKKKEPAKPCDM